MSDELQAQMDKIMMKMMNPPQDEIDKIIKESKYLEYKEMKNNIRSISIQQIKEMMELDSIKPIEEYYTVSAEDAAYYNWIVEEKLRDNFVEFLDGLIYEERNKLMKCPLPTNIDETGKIEIDWDDVRHIAFYDAWMED